MRIGLTSDIHTDFSSANRKIVEHIVDVIGKANPDVFIICGDISPDVITLSKTLLAFHDLDAKKLFIAGNHDIWIANGKKKVSSSDKYSLITKVCKECGFHHLGSSPLIIDRVGFCGTIGWYDYSYRIDKYSIPESSYMKKTFGNSVWNDVNYARWNATDIKVAHHFENELKNQIDLVRDQVSQVVVVTHHVPFRECVFYRNELPWDFFSAFMGSQGLGEICHADPIITHAFFGHTHTEYNTKVKNVQAVCSPIGYLTDPPNDLHKYAQSRIKIIDLS